MTYAINYNGLRRRETYEEIIDYLGNKQEKLKYPDRSAKQLRETPQLSNLLDGEGMSILDVERQNDQRVREEIKQHRIHEQASQTEVPAQHLRAASSTQTEIPREEIFHDVDDGVDQAGQDIDMEVQNREESQVHPLLQIARVLQADLERTTPNTIAHQMASSSSSSATPMLIDGGGEQQVPEKTVPTTSSKAPMLVGREGEQHKRGTGNGNGEAKKKAKEDQVPQTAVVKALEQHQNTTSSSSSAARPTVKAIEATPTATSSASSSKPKEEPKKEAPKEEPETERPKPEKPKPPVKKTIDKDKPRVDPHGTKINTNSNPKWWERQNVPYLIDQLQLHEVRFTKEQLKGKNKLKKAELVQMIKEKLGI